jgi:hypothetical protein
MDILISEIIKLIIRLFTGESAKAKTPPLPATPGAPPQGRRQPAPPRRSILGRPPAARRAPARGAAPPIEQVIKAATQQPPTAAAPAPSIVHRPSAGIDAAVLRRWLRPQVLRNQFIFSEIFQPPLALRERE